MGRHRKCDRRINPRDLLDADAVVDGRHPGAAVFVRKLDAHQPQRGHARHQLGRKLLVPVPRAHVRTHFRLSEFTHAATQQLLLRGQTNVHRALR